VKPSGSGGASDPLISARRLREVAAYTAKFLNNLDVRIEHGVGL
jgi:hypothetical protein